jgi:hypothetical protein
LQRILPAVAVSVVITLGCWSLIVDPAPRGEGSYRDAKRIIKRLAELDFSAVAAQPPKGYYYLQGMDGFGYIATGTDSHQPGGGTMGILFEGGSAFVFFTHVCGSGPTPLAFPGRSQQEVLAAIREASIEYKP